MTRNTGFNYKSPFSRLAVIMAVVLISIFSTTSNLIVCLAQGDTQTEKSSPDPAVVKNKISSILSSSDYSAETHDESGLSKTLRGYVQSAQKMWEQIQKWLEQQWDKISRLFGGAGGIKASGNLFISLFLVLCLAAIAYFLLRYVSGLKGSPKVKSGLVSGKTYLDDDTLAEALSRSHSEWMREAIEQANSENYRRAIRALFLSSLTRLDDTGLIDFSKASTNGDFLYHLNARHAPQVAAPFQLLVEDFEKYWYGEHHAVEADFLAARERCKLLEDALSNRTNGFQPANVEGVHHAV